MKSANDWRVLYALPAVSGRNEGVTGMLVDDFPIQNNSSCKLGMSLLPHFERHCSGRHRRSLDQAGQHFQLPGIEGGLLGHLTVSSGLCSNC